MVLESRRSLVTANKLTRAARPRPFEPVAFARRCLVGSLLAGIALLGVIAMVAPSNFGRPGSNTLHTGWPSYVLIVVIASALGAGLLRRAELAWLTARIREPFERRLDELTGFDDAADALASCPPVLVTRYALAWVWGPIGVAIAGVTFAFSAAYFLVDGILARFRVGWGQPLYAATFCALSYVVFVVGAGRLASWRFATSVHKEVTAGYAEPAGD
jgi:hypothetical protein